MNRRCYLEMILLILKIIICHGKNWMYSKSWIEDYRINVKYGLPYQHVPTEYSMETHKIGVIQKENERFLNEGGYDFRESSTVLRTMRNITVHNKATLQLRLMNKSHIFNTRRNILQLDIFRGQTVIGEIHVGQLLSDLIIVPKNVTHSIPSVKVDMILLEKTRDEFVNFIGVLESPKNDDYSSLSSSIRNAKRNSSISYEFVLCGNDGRNDMLSIGFVAIHYDTDYDFNKHIIQDAAVIDPYLFMVVVKSLMINGTTIATCQELNVRGAIFDNTVPGIYLPFMIFRRFMNVINDYANEHNVPVNMKIWERRNYICFEGPVDWNIIPVMKIEFFANENETIEVSYSGQSLVKRYYTKNSKKTTFCYIFAIRKTDEERLIFGRSAFEGVRLIFNRTKQAVSFMYNTCCGPRVQLRKLSKTKENMLSCRSKNLRSMTMNLDTNWIWIVITAIILAILACLFSIPRSLKRGYFARPTIHVICLPQNRTVK